MRRESFASHSESLTTTSCIFLCATADIEPGRQSDMAEWGTALYNLCDVGLSLSILPMIGFPADHC